MFQHSRAWIVGLLFLSMTIFWMPFIATAQGSVTVDVGSPVNITATSGVTCDYREDEFTVPSTGEITVIAQGSPGTSSVVDCDDGVTLRIIIRNRPTNGFTNTPIVCTDGCPADTPIVCTDGCPTDTPTTPDPMVCEGVNATSANSHCNPRTDGYPIRVYNCDVADGLHVRSIGSTEGNNPTTWMAVGSSIEVDGIIATSDSRNWYYTDGGRYIAAWLLQETECGDILTINDFSECPDLFDDARNFNASLLLQDDLNDFERCALVETIIRRRNVPSLLTTAAQDNLIQDHCLNDPDYDAALTSLIYLLETLREHDIQSHLALRDQIELAGENTCDFVKDLMNNQIMPNYVFTGEDDDVQVARMLRSITLSCEPFINVNLMEQIISSMIVSIGIDIDDIQNADADSLCSIVSNLAILGGIPTKTLSELTVLAALTDAVWCEIPLSETEALAVMVAIRAAGFDPSVIANTLVPNADNAICSLLANATALPPESLYIYLFDLIDAESLDSVALETIATVIRVSGCAADDIEITRLTFLFEGQWENMTAIERVDILASEDPCDAIVTYIQLGITPVLGVTDAGYEAYDDAERDARAGSRTTIEEVIIPVMEDNADTIIANPQEPLPEGISEEAIAVALAQNENATSIWTLHDGEWQQTYVSSSQQNILSVAVSADGRRILYLVEENGIYRVYQSELTTVVINDEETVVLESTNNSFLVQTDLNAYELSINPEHVRIAYAPDQETIMLTLADSEGQLDIYELTINNNDGLGVVVTQAPINMSEDITTNIGQSAVHASYSPDGGFAVFVVEDNNADNQIYWGRIDTLNNQDGFIYTNPVIFTSCANPRYPIFNANVASILFVCDGNQQGMNVIAERNIRSGSRNIGLSNAAEVNVGNPIRLNDGPVEGFFTVFNDTNQTFIITLANNDEQGLSNYDIHKPVELTPDEENSWQLQQIYWAQSESSAVDIVDANP